MLDYNFHVTLNVDLRVIGGSDHMERQARALVGRTSPVVPRRSVIQPKPTIKPSWLSSQV